MACLFLALGGSLWAEDNPPLEEPDLQLPELDELDSMWWDTSGSLRLESGYKDNPQLSSVNPVGSLFATVGGDFMVYRLPVDGFELSVFGELEHIEYLEEGLDAETLGILDVRAKKTQASGWDWGGTFEYFFLHQVFDASELEGVPTIVRAEGHTAALRPTVGRALGGGWHVELEGEGSRQWLAEPLDGFWDGGARLALKYSPHELTEYGLFYRHRDRFFDHRVPLTSDGSPLEGTLRFAQHEMEGNWQRTWSTNGVWRTTLRAGYLRNDDNGGGLYDYDRVLGSVGVRARWPRLELRAEVRARWYLYAQPALGAVSQAERRRFDLTYSFRGEYRLGRKLKAYLNYENESSDETASSADYRLNTVLIGLAYDL